MATSTLAQALLAVQKEMPAIKADTVNPHFKSEFVSLDRLLAVTVPILNKHGIVLVQAPTGGEVVEQALITKLIHAESGESEFYVMPLVLEKQNSQGQGSAITYARRYALTAMLGISGEKDDDGNAASPAPAPKGGTPDPSPAAPTPGSEFLIPPELKSSEKDRDDLMKIARKLITENKTTAADVSTRACKLERELTGAEVAGPWPDLVDFLSKPTILELTQRLVNYDKASEVLVEANL